MIQTIITKHYDSLTVKGKIVASEILELGDQVCFMTVRQLSQHANVSTLTVVRTVRDLGFDGYSDFQRPSNATSIIKGLAQATPSMPKVLTKRSIKRWISPLNKLRL